jgi:hypothetical protein
VLGNYSLAMSTGSHAHWPTPRWRCFNRISRNDPAKGGECAYPVWFVGSRTGAKSAFLGVVEEEKSFISSEGKTRTIVTEGKNDQGQDMKNTIVYDRQ